VHAWPMMRRAVVTPDCSASSLDAFVISRSRSKISRPCPRRRALRSLISPRRALYPNKRAPPGKASSRPRPTRPTAFPSVPRRCMRATEVDRYRRGRPSPAASLASFGTSPHRYLPADRLDRLNAEIARGIPPLSRGGRLRGGPLASLNQSHMNPSAFQSPLSPASTPGRYSGIVAQGGRYIPIPAKARQSGRGRQALSESRGLARSSGYLRERCFQALFCSRWAAAVRNRVLLG